MFSSFSSTCQRTSKKIKMDADNILSIFLIIGIIGTFSPQYVRILKRKSSLGLSPLFLTLGITSVYAQMANVIIMQLPVIQECKNGAPSCLSDVLAIVQVFVLSLCITTNCILFLIYYPKPFDLRVEGREAKKCIYAFYVYMGICIFTTFMVMASSGIESVHTRNLGRFFGLLCTVLSCVQYVPQIWRTYASKTIGSLSVVSLSIQAPGSYFFAYSVGIRPHTDVSTWGAFFISGTFQLILVLLCLYLKYTGQEKLQNLEEEIREDGDIEREIESDIERVNSEHSAHHKIAYSSQNSAESSVQDSLHTYVNDNERTPLLK